MPLVVTLPITSSRGPITSLVVTSSWSEAATAPHSTLWTLPPRLPQSNSSTAPETLTARPDIVERVRQDSRIEDLSGWEVESVHGTEGLQEVVLEHSSTGERRKVAAGGLIVKISRLPSTAVFRGQLELDLREAIVVDGALQTSRPGVFAAGDVVAGSYWRVATAFGQGVLTARSILRHLEAMQ